MITMEYGIYSGGILVAKKGFDVHDNRPNGKTAHTIATVLDLGCGQWPDSYWLPLDPEDLPDLGSPEPAEVRTVANS